MPAVHPYITLKNTKEALEYYKEVLGATNIDRLSLSEEKAKELKLTKEQADNITIYSQFDVLETTIMATDDLQNKNLAYNGISILINIDSTDKKIMKEAKNFWDHAVKSDDVVVDMSFGNHVESSELMGQFTDKYGISWVLRAK